MQVPRFANGSCRPSGRAEFLYLKYFSSLSAYDGHDQVKNQEGGPSSNHNNGKVIGEQSLFGGILVDAHAWEAAHYDEL